MVKVLSVQVIAKIIRLAVYSAALYFVQGTVVPSVLFSGILTSLPGVALQLVVVTVLIAGRKKENE